jgi:hypothetical protein
VNPPIVVPRPAATVILARDTSDGIEVFMMQRTTEVAFAKGMQNWTDDEVEELLGR